MVTHLTTNPPVHCLYMAERTGSLIFSVLWSYVHDGSCSSNIYSRARSISMPGILFHLTSWGSWQLEFSDWASCLQSILYGLRLKMIRGRFKVWSRWRLRSYMTRCKISTTLAAFPIGELVRTLASRFLERSIVAMQNDRLAIS